MSVRFNVKTGEEPFVPPPRSVEVALKTERKIDRRRKAPEQIPPGSYCEKRIATRKGIVPESLEWRRVSKSHWQLFGCSKKDWLPKRKWRDRTGQEHVGKCSFAMRPIALRIPKKPHRHCPTGTRCKDATGTRCKAQT